MGVYSRSSALNNFQRFGQNQYPGRVIVMGVAEDGKHIIQLYAITGRSVGSRNRVLKAVDDCGSTGEKPFQYKSRVFTDVADQNKVDKNTNKDLIIYNAIIEDGGRFIVSNGRQTDIVLNSTNNLDVALRSFQYEPDLPNYTSRITGVCTLKPCNQLFEFSVLRKSPWCDGCYRVIYPFTEIEAGFGFGIMTYAGDGNPLPAFTEDPILLPLDGSPEEIADDYWNDLDMDNRVALAVKAINIVTGKSSTTVINKYAEVPLSAVV
jgi:hypothetical protein